jgi:hypothetical protein
MATAQKSVAWSSIAALAIAPRRDERAKSFVKPWHDLMEAIVSKSADLWQASYQP